MLGTSLRNQLTKLLIEPLEGSHLFLSHNSLEIFIPQIVEK